MTTEQMNELLADIIFAYAPRFGRSLNKKVALKLVTSSVEEVLENIAGDSYELAKTALSECGAILEESVADHTIAGLIMSGAANMNPAFVVLGIEGDHIHVKASAKEGLIKQHTAEKAIEIFKSSLAAQCSLR